MPIAEWACKCHSSAGSGTYTGFGMQAQPATNGVAAAKVSALVLCILNPNARRERRGAEDLQMQTERAIPRPLQAARWPLL